MEAEELRNERIRRTVQWIRNVRGALSLSIQGLREAALRMPQRDLDDLPISQRIEQGRIDLATVETALSELLIDLERLLDTVQTPPDSQDPKKGG